MKVTTFLNRSTGRKHELKTAIKDDVDTDDLNALHVALGINNTDINNNGCVDIEDLLSVIEDWNEGCTP